MLKMSQRVVAIFGVTVIGLLVWWAISSFNETNQVDAPQAVVNTSANDIKQVEAENVSDQNVKPEILTLPGKTPSKGPNRGVYYPYRWPLREGKIIDWYDEYAKRAISGDAAAAYMLASALVICNSYYKNYDPKEHWAEMKKHINEMEKEEPNSEQARKFKADSEALFVDTKAKAVACDGLTAEHDADHDRWIQMAAEGGHSGAQVDYGRFGLFALRSAEDAARNPELAEQFKKNLMRYLQSAAEVCNVDAFAHLYLMYAFGDTPFTGKDIKLGYAYYLAYFNSGKPHHPETPLLPKWAVHLNKNEIFEAEKMSKDILVKNCSGGVVEAAHY